MTKIEATNEETDDLVKQEKREQNIRNELKEKFHDLSENVVPDLEYQIQKRSEELRYQTMMSTEQQKTTNSLMMEAMACRLKEQLAQMQ